MRIAVDAMGGDYAPQEIIKGCIHGAREYGYEVILVGDENIIKTHLMEYSLKARKNISVYHAEQVIGMGEAPARACKEKKNSSIMVACRLVADGLADGVVSAGNSGAMLIASVLHFGLVRGVTRPAIAALFPTLGGFSMILDVGANVDCKPMHLLQFAIMGHTYAKYILNKPLPKIGLLSIGEEENKGNEVTRQAYELLKRSRLNFVGNIEGYDIFEGKADVIVCDGFMGNVILKLSEGVIDVVFKLLNNKLREKPIRTKLATLVVKSMFKDVKKLVDYSEYGGAPLLGVNGVCIISHGKSKANAIKNAIRTAVEVVEQRISQLINLELEKIKELLNEREEDLASWETMMK
jgi:glycerol-3-phosphate acyltransferase PlsX